MDKLNNNNTFDASKLPDDQILNNSKGPTPNNKSFTQEEANKLFNIPHRDNTRYPLPSENELKTAADFLMNMNSMASAYDGNLYALIWQFYKEWVIYLRAKETKSEQIVEMVGKLEALRTYIKESNNPMLV